MCVYDITQTECAKNADSFVISNNEIQKGGTQDATDLSCWERQAAASGLVQVPASNVRPLVGPEHGPFLYSFSYRRRRWSCFATPWMDGYLTETRPSMRFSL